MARVFGNILTAGLRGKIGDMLVFRVIRGKTFVSRAPGKPDKRKETVAQRNTRTTFRLASHWAKSTLRDPEKKKYYQQRAKDWDLTNAYTAAIKDYMRNASARTVHDQDASESPAAVCVQPRLETIIVNKSRGPLPAINEFTAQPVRSKGLHAGLVKRRQPSSVFSWERDE